jgi:cytochrome c peroxidase
MLGRFLLHALMASMLVLVCVTSGFAEDSASTAPVTPANLLSYKRPASIPFPASAPYSPQRAALGKMLFFDPRLSGAQNLSCASCHNPSFGFEVPVPGAIGSANTPLPRKAPTILNAAFTPIFFWDGRAKSLEDQAQGPIQAPAEMNGNFHDIVGLLEAVPEYKAWFAAEFPELGISKETVLTAIATYERTVVTGFAPFDFWVEGDQTAMSESAKRGFAIFSGKAGCSNCHNGWNFTDNQFHDIGISDNDIGRGKLEPDNMLAQHAFKTPGLRNLIYRAPFGHAGQMPDLASIIRFYETGGVDRPSKSPLIKPFALSDQEFDDLIAFLKSLTAEKTETALPNLPN